MQVHKSVLGNMCLLRYGAFTGAAVSSLALQWPNGWQVLTTLPFNSQKRGLPQPVGNQGPKQHGDPFISVKLATTVDDIPPLLSSPKAKCWDSETNRLWIQTDNQQVEQIFAGRSI